MATIKLCSNCLENGSQPRTIGDIKGTQRDPYYDTISLCAVCWQALYSGDLKTFSERYQQQRVITR